MIWRPEVVPPCNSGSKREKTKPLRLLEYLIKANFCSKINRNRSTQVSNLWNTFSDNDTPLNTKEAIQIVEATCRRLIRARNNDCHRRLNYYNNKLQQRLDKLKQLIPTNLLDTILTIADKRANKTEEV